MKKSFFIGLVSFMSLSVPQGNMYAQSTDAEKGWEALNQGDYSNAVEYFTNHLEVRQTWGV
ncbi:hypothetical protein AGMMS49965_19340 [Bacteroidia bacterium]|nr:hypothetical protein AGMMS49965_19340 [Bacteroidia bacterium]